MHNLLLYFQYLKVCHANVRSLASKPRLLDLEILSISHNIDVLCLSETWLSSSILSSSISLPGFQLPLRRDRPENKNGGVAVYVRNNLSVKLVSLPESLTIECLCINIQITQRTKLNIVVAYRSPSFPADVFFEELDTAVSYIQGKSNTPLCIVGDFNSKHADWLHGQQTNAAGKHAMNFCLNNSLQLSNHASNTWPPLCKPF